MESWFRKTLQLSVPSDSDRVIEGIATAPIYDRVGELITSEAIQKAMDDFMVLPVITCGHQDFPVGKVESYWFGDSGELHVRCQLKKTSDVDDVWRLCKEGVLNAFSISGRRTNTTCTKTSKMCKTTGIHLYSIALCGDDKCNPAATFNIVKSLIGADNMTEDVPMAETIEADVAKTVETPAITLDTLSALLDQKLSAFAKTVEAETQEETPEVDFAKSMDEFSKSMDQKLEEILLEQNKLIKTLTERVEALEAEPVRKGGVIINETGEPEAVGDVDPLILAKVRARLRGNRA